MDGLLFWYCSTAALLSFGQPPVSEARYQPAIPNNAIVTGTAIIFCSYSSSITPPSENQRNPIGALPCLASCNILWTRSGRALLETLTRRSGWNSPISARGCTESIDGFSEQIGEFAERAAWKHVPAEDHASRLPSTGARPILGDVLGVAKLCGTEPKPVANFVEPSFLNKNCSIG